MHTIYKYIFGTLDITFFFGWCLNLITLFNQNIGKGFDSLISSSNDIIQLLMAVAGLIYFVIMSFNKYHTHKIERHGKHLDNKLKERELNKTNKI